MSRDHGPSGLEVVALALLVGLGAGLLLTWLWGGLAGAVFGSGWPRLGLPALVGVLGRLPFHLGHPEEAWPVWARDALPPQGLLYACLLPVAAVLLGVALAASRIVSSRGRRRGSGARWASVQDLAALRRTPKIAGRLGLGRTRKVDGRLGLGRYRGHVLYGEQRHALMAFGPPQSGKSAGLAIPALLEWEGPAIASSIKTDLLDATWDRRSRLGRALVFDPFRLTGGPSHTWSPLRCASSWEGALEAAWRLTAAAEVDSRGVEGGDFWSVAAEQRLAPLLFAAARSHGRIEQVVGWAYGQGGRSLDDALETAGRAAATAAEQADASAAYEAVQAFRAQADRTRSSIEATAQALLRAYRFNRVARSANGCEITAEALLQGNHTLYLIGDAKASKLLRPIFLALLSEMIDGAYELANRAGGRLVRPLLVCLDEAGNVAPLPNLAEVASTAPSHNIQLVSIFHDIAQARSRYGQQAETLVNSHRARMLLPGVADLETLRYFAGLIGEEEAAEVTRTSGAGGQSRSTGRRRRPLLAAESLRQLPEGTALLLYGRLAPVRLRLRLWFEDRRLRQLAKSNDTTRGKRGER